MIKDSNSNTGFALVTFKMTKLLDSEKQADEKIGLLEAFEALCF